MPALPHEGLTKTLSMPGKSPVPALLAHAKRLHRRRWRQLVWLTGEPAECRAQALELWQGAYWLAPLWVAHQADNAPVEPWITPRKARTRLGTEHQLVIMDASGSAGFDPEALGALAGTLTAGGLLVLITPYPWGERPDPDYARFADHPWQWEQLTAHYLARLARLLDERTDIVTWHAPGWPQLPRLTARSAHLESVNDSACATADQAATVTQLMNLKRRRPLVITADRGRGKSAALGIACARLLESGMPIIIVTAPRLDAVESLFTRLEALCPEGARITPSRFQLANKSELCFLPPDVLTEQVAAQKLGGDGSYLMVDEAAAIPAFLLGQWLSAFPRIAFATTIDGYEGSGRGFALRFRSVLDRLTPQWKALTPNTPIRWAVGDPLEATVNQLLMLKAPLPAGQRFNGPLTSQVIIRGELAHNENALEAVFGLLVQSHYRTSPSDLRQLLDGPGTTLRLVGQTNAPQAVLVAREEGGFDASLAEQVALGKRRPQGHLMAQSLAAHMGSRAALTASWRRVVRIATHPERRREGLGRKLIDDDSREAARQGIALYGATFGAEASLLRFWLAQGFTPVRLGITRETATGEFAVMAAKALNAEGQAVLSTLKTTFAAALPGLLAFELPTLPAEVVSLLLQVLPRAPLTADERQAVNDVAYAHRDPVLARPALQALARETSVTQAALIAHQQLAAWAFQNRPLAVAHGDAVRALRQAIEQLTAHGMLFPHGVEE
ncbi:tRNA(Met) cytidine acetyltransferase TmcA [Vreelandella populi]|uniref:tRNA(Met) cytidine acetyltransferase TmcA n=1 Tax=Vreelandella populi TaxID=2498858 RepID=A0A3S0YI41_9GAMM|nr:GNAT family N-acetyltransferase [Halomonas populi]RUR36993.1 tRNA(Met) cytidine acetyltransferase [Halomonas populi]RUR44036.1 tRNA(Met) cytidine acetyltransferase [Halomonas populi]